MFLSMLTSVITDIFITVGLSGRQPVTSTVHHTARPSSLGLPLHAPPPMASLVPSAKNVLCQLF